jgi:hypothetical protein
MAQSMKKSGKSITRALHAFITALLSLAVLNFIAFLVPFNFLTFFAGSELDRNTIINYAPEVWLALLAFVFGTLIIVISIASESTPKLIDLFVKDYKSRYYIWIITLSILQNVFLQLIHTQHTVFFDNLIYFNNYVLLPFFIVLAIPYIFYILRYTKNSNVIQKIYDENRSAIRSAIKLTNTPLKINENHQVIFETINQLQDLLQYVQFKEPKAEIINKFGKSLRFYIERKRLFNDRYFKLSYAVQNDISFKTLVDKFSTIEKGKIFYEQKVLNAFTSSYHLLIQESLFDLASLCGNELYESGKTAIEMEDDAALELIIVHFNTLIRFGMNQGLKTKEIRNVYNMIFHYTQLVNALIQKRKEDKIIQCCRYLNFYGNETGKLSASDQVFVFLHDAFAIGLKKTLFSLYENHFDRPLQLAVLKMFNELCSQEIVRMANVKGVNYSNTRIIQVALCLFYLEHEEKQFTEITTDFMLKDLRNLHPEAAEKVINSLCDRIGEEAESFWEETDQGNRNIFYSPHKGRIPDLHKYLHSKLAINA